MLSNFPRCHYKNSSLVEVICQLRFSEIPSINSITPLEFSAVIREQFPQYSAVQEQPAGGNSPVILNHQFISNDGVWRVNLTTNFISLSCNHYTDWKTFANHLDHPLASFIQIYKPDTFTRIGLRYINFFSRERLHLEGVPFRELFAPKYLGLMSDDMLSEKNFYNSIVEADFALGSNCRAKVHAGPGMVKRDGQQDPNINFILDLDYYTSGNIPINYAAGTLENLHDRTYPLFRGAITPLLHNAMEPDE